LKKILIISQHFPPDKSGNASRIFDIAYYLTILGSEVRVLSPPPSFPSGNFKRSWNLSFSSNIKGIFLTNLWTWQPKKKDPTFLNRMAYYLIFPLHASLWIFFNQKKFDIIITSAPPLFTHIPGFIAKRLFGKQWMMDIRDLWIDASISLGFVKKGSLSEQLSRDFQTKCLKNADRIGVTTSELGRRITYDDTIKNKIKLVPNGVDLEKFPSHNIIKKQQIIYAGNVGHAQDLENVIHAMKIITSKQIPLKLLIVGDGDILPFLKRLVEQEHLETVVYFQDPLPREEIPKILGESLIGLAPLKKMESLEYAAPTKVYEYMASSMPFLGCGKGEIENIARDSGSGVIAENNPESIGKEIIELVSNQIKMEQMGANGRQYVSEFYDRKTIAKQLQTYLEEIS